MRSPYKPTAMDDLTIISRRTLVKSSVFGLLAASIPNVSFAKEMFAPVDGETKPKDLFHRYPSIDDEVVSTVVGASHFDFDKVKDFVTKRPELARATWDWSFGDWETAIGAASHVGRRDIAELLIDHGARPDIFTFAMFGNYDAVKSMIEAREGVQSLAGPHGISLLSHVKAGLRYKEITTKQKEEGEALLAYLEKRGDADPKAKDIEMSEEDMQKYLGDYLYGDGPTDGFSVKINMRKMLSLGKLGNFGGGLFQKAPNVFTYNGVTSVEIKFQVEGDKVKSLTVVEPDLTLVATKV